METIKEKIIDRNYGSIPHLSISKLSQQADKKINIGQEIILTKKARDWRDLIIVTEKLDGSNVGVIRKDDKLIGLTRAGYDAWSSPYRQHHYFASWLEENIHLFYLLPEGYRVCGEWMLQAHGTKYNITELCPFVAFDIYSNENKRMPYIEFIKFCSESHINHVPLVHIGQPVSIKNVMKLVTNWGKCEEPEGVVYRCERNNEFDFAAKFVRSNKIDGKYMFDEIWNEGQTLI